VRERVRERERSEHLAGRASTRGSPGQPFIFLDLARMCGRQGHLNKLVKVEGVCTRRTAIFPQLEMVKFDCNQCGYTLGPFLQNSDSELKLGSCPNCQGKGPFTVRPNCPRSP
jgi:DNA-directed RNA polymerase subunit RPC12/RpoP